MSSYSQAKILIHENKDLVDHFGGASSELIAMGETKLGVQFPSDYRKFLLEYGALTFGAAEIYGVLLRILKIQEFPMQFGQLWMNVGW
ncbi:SMI1/KNR4 family protein [Lactiplantibacillus plantarum]|uniref:SMI1/KNR4 family protein n=1 Tax=Lactiplantibacillus plantarum TaxID=1590 RepID=UPI000AD7A82E|nr:SMI1/KNR4 family protein [Lactiplantibacillus plantarum]